MADNWNGVPLAAIGSGLIPEPPQGRTYPPQINVDDPFERAAYRQQQSVRPAFGRAGEGPSIEGIVRTAVPGADLVLTARENATNRRGGQQLPLGSGRKSGQNTGPSLAEILGIGSADAAEFSEPQPQRSSEIQSKIDAINKGLAPDQTRLDRLKANFEGGRIDKNEYNRQRVPLESRIERSKGQINEIDAPFQRQLTDWEQRKSSSLQTQEAADQALREKQANAELPFRVKYPKATQDIVSAGAGLTGATAVALGILGKGKIKPTLGAMGVGAIEGAGTANLPELLDLGGMQPRGSVGWNKTWDQLTSPNNLIASGAEGAAHALSGGALSYGTSLGREIAARTRQGIRNLRSPGTPPQPGSPPSPTTTPGATLSTLGGSAGSPSQAPGASLPLSSAQPTVFTRGGQTFALMPGGQVLKQSGSGWHGPDGKWIKKSDWPTLGSLGQGSN
jgi:hypothetical protein